MFRPRAHAFQGSTIIDLGAWPLVTVRFIETVPDEAWANYLDEMTGVLFRPGIRALIYDASRCGLVRASQRRMKSDWMSAHADRIREVTAGIAFVVPSAAIRGMLTAVFWLSPLQAPHAVVGSLTQAYACCRGWLDARGVDMPALTGT